MSDVTFYVIAALIGFVGALVSQVLTLQQSLQIRSQIGNLEKKKKYCDAVIRNLCVQRDGFQKRMWELEEKIALAKDTPEDKTETQYREFYDLAKQQKEEMVKVIVGWDKQRNDLANEIFSARKGHFASPWFLLCLNVVVGAALTLLFGYVEVLTRGAGNATLSANLVIEFLFVGAFWPLIWQRMFSAKAVQERVDAAVARFGIEAGGGEDSAAAKPSP